MLSLIIPCYNESKNLHAIYSKILEVMNSINHKDFNFEIIFIDDGSIDNTYEILCELSEKDNRCKNICFSRNFGKESAMLAGLTNSSGDAVIILDADLQHPPELIIEMLKYYDVGYHQVIAQRDRTGDSKFKTFYSQFYYKFVNKFIDVKLTDGMGDFRLLSRKAVNALLSLDEYNRFSKGLFSWIGFKSICIRYNNQERFEGKSKWSIKKLFNYAVDGVISFNDKPLRLTIGMGMVVTSIGVIYVIISLILILIWGIDLPGYFTTISSILILGGVQLLSIGVIGEYIGKIYYEVKKRPHYLIDKTNLNKEETDNNINRDIDNKT